MVRRSVPDSSNWVAKLWRKVWTVTCLSNPAARRARRQILLTLPVVRGESAVAPGKRKSAGRAALQSARRISSSRGESMT
jgi:hypothetical protein